MSINTQFDPAQEVPLYDFSLITAAIDKSDTAFLHQLTDIFIESMSTSLVELLQAGSDRDTDEIRRISHKMKSSIELFGVDALMPLLIQLENIDAGNPNINEYLNKVSELLHKVMEQLKRF